MDLIRNILSHFQKNKSIENSPITINGVTIHQIDNNLQQNNVTTELNEKYLEVPPPKKIKKEVDEFNNNDILQTCHSSEARVTFDDEHTKVSANKNNIFTVIDFTDSLEVQNVSEVDKTAAYNNISEPRVPFDAVSEINNDIDLADNVNSRKVHNISEICKTAVNSTISETSDKPITNRVNNENTKYQNDTNKDPSISKGNKSSDGKYTECLIKNTNKATIIDELDNPFKNNSQNIVKFGETTENPNITSEYNETEVSLNYNRNLTTIDNTDNYNCNKLHISYIKPTVVTNYLTGNNELTLTNNNTEETTTDCIREFEDILANVENKLNLDAEINIDDVNELINDFKLDSDDEFQLYDAESQIPTHIVRKNLDKHVPTDVINLITVKSVSPNKPNKFPEETNGNTEKDRQIKSTAAIGSTIVTAVTNTSFNIINSNTEQYSKTNIIENDSNAKQDVIINTNNGNTNATDKTIDFDTISISSDENTNITEPIYISDSSDSDCGYHSSDFEFITEEEAKREGLIINKSSNFTNKEFNAKPNSKQPKKKTSKDKNVQAQPSRTLKMPDNGKNAKARTRKPLKRYSNDIISVRPGSSQCLGALNVQKIPKCSSNPVHMSSYVQAGPSNFVQNTSYMQVRRSNPIQTPSYFQAGPSNIVHNPSYMQAGRSIPIQSPSNVRPRPTNPFQLSFNIQAGPSNPVQNFSNIEVRPSNLVQLPFNIQAGPSNPVKMSSNIQAGPSHPVKMSFNIQAGPSNPVKMSSNIQAGPSNSELNKSNIQASSPALLPSNIQAGPSNPAQNPSDILAGPSNPVQIFSNIQAGPSNLVQNPSNVQPLPNYENYRNKYKKPFQYDTGYKNNHNEPEGSGYIDLFRGFHAGVYPMYTRENKSLNPHFSNANRVWYQGKGFDMRRNSSDEDDEFIDEAYETVRKIKSEYPIENRKRRFRNK